MALNKEQESVVSEPYDISEIENLLDETFHFASTRPAAQENILAVLDLLREKPLYTSPQPLPEITEEESRLISLEEEVRFLIERLDDFERGSLSDGIEDACRDFDGHVSPSIERLRALLSFRRSDR